MGRQLALLVASLPLAVTGCGHPNEFGGEGWVAGRVVLCQPDHHCVAFRASRRTAVYVAARLIGQSGTEHVAVFPSSGEFGFYTLPGTYRATLTPGVFRGLITTPVEFTVKAGKTTHVRLAYRGST